MCSPVRVAPRTETAKLALNQPSSRADGALCGDHCSQDSSCAGRAEQRPFRRQLGLTMAAKRSIAREPTARRVGNAVAKLSQDDLNDRRRPSLLARTITNLTNLEPWRPWLGTWPLVVGGWRLNRTSCRIAARQPTPDGRSGGWAGATPVDCPPITAGARDVAKWAARAFGWSPQSSPKPIETAVPELSGPSLKRDSMQLIWLFSGPAATVGTCRMQRKPGPERGDPLPTLARPVARPFQISA